MARGTGYVIESHWFACPLRMEDIDGHLGSPTPCREALGNEFAALMRLKSFDARCKMIILHYNLRDTSTRGLRREQNLLGHTIWIHGHQLSPFKIGPVFSLTLPKAQEMMTPPD